MRTNRKPETLRTHEGGVASRISPEQMLRRSVMACMLWENTFYEDGVSIAERIESLVATVDPVSVAEIACEARDAMNLRHVPLLLCVALARHGKLKADTLASVIQRPDELTEFLSIYWKDGRCPIAAQAKKGLAKAFTKFNAYSLAKYNRDNAIKLRDVLFLCHAKPKDDTQAKAWHALVDGTLESPDTWEVALSSGGDKKAHWTRLLTENKLGGLALLRNLRNFKDAGVAEHLVHDMLSTMNTDRILPFRFIAAALHAPQWESWIEEAMLRSLSQAPKLKGKTIFIVDVSGSMYGANISKYSEMDRAHAACALAIPIREICENVQIYATAGSDYSSIHKTELVPSRHGFALSDAIYSRCQPLGGGGIFLKQVMDYVRDQEKTADRIIVITDEQDCDNSKSGAASKADAFGTHNYLLNVSTYKNGINFGAWTHINGFSESILKYILELEKL